MSDVLNINTLELRVSVHTPDFAPEWTTDQGTSLHGEWIVNPDISAVQNVPQKHRKLDLENLTLVEMKQDEKDAADAAEAEAQKTSVIEQKIASVDFDALAIASGAKDAEAIKAEYRTLIESKEIGEIEVGGL